MDWLSFVGDNLDRVPLYYFADIGAYLLSEQFVEGNDAHTQERRRLLRKIRGWSAPQLSMTAVGELMLQRPLSVQLVRAHFRQLLLPQTPQIEELFEVVGAGAPTVSAATFTSSLLAQAGFVWRRSIKASESLFGLTIDRSLDEQLESATTIADAAKVVFNYADLTQLPEGPELPLTHRQTESWWVSSGLLRAGLEQIPENLTRALYVVMLQGLNSTYGGLEQPKTVEAALELSKQDNLFHSYYILDQLGELIRNKTEVPLRSNFSAIAADTQNFFSENVQALARQLLEEQREEVKVEGQSWFLPIFIGLVVVLITLAITRNWTAAFAIARRTEDVEKNQPGQATQPLQTPPGQLLLPPRQTIQLPAQSSVPPFVATIPIRNIAPDDLEQAAQSVLADIKNNHNPLYAPQWNLSTQQRFASYWPDTPTSINDLSIITASVTDEQNSDFVFDQEFWPKIDLPTLEEKLNSARKVLLVGYQNRALSPQEVSVAERLL